MIKYKERFNARGDFMKKHIKAYAKINLVLDVLGKREDGYHELDMIMQKVDLCDVVSLELREDDKILIESNSPYVPNGRSNIAYRAVEAFMKETGIDKGVDIYIEKNIPVAAGLAGGSTDAAAVLKGLNEMHGDPLPFEALLEIGASLGADVPFCMLDGTYRATGTGTDLEPVKGIKDLYILIVKPFFSLSTADIYGSLKKGDYSKTYDVGQYVNLLESEDLEGIFGGLYNVLEKPAIRKSKEITKIKGQLRSYGARGALMSGSGPTVFALFRKEKKALQAMGNISKFYREVYIAKPINRAED